MGSGSAEQPAVLVHKSDPYSYTQRIDWWLSEAGDRDGKQRTKGGQKVQTSSSKINTPWGVTYSMVTIVNHIVYLKVAMILLLKVLIR